MKRAVILLLFIVISTALTAQDKKMRLFYESGMYCKVLKRYDKLSVKKRTVRDLYYRAAAFYKIFEKNDTRCDISNPYAKAVTALARALKHKNASNVTELPILKKDILDAGKTLCMEAFEAQKPAKALKWATVINENFEEPFFVMAEAYASYLTNAPLAQYIAEKAIKMYSKTDETEHQHFTAITEKLLLYLDSVRHNDFRPLMDLLLTTLGEDTHFATIFYNISKKDIHDFRNRGDYTHLFNTIGIIFQHYPNRDDWHNEIAGIILNISDSLTGLYTHDSTRIDAIFEACNLLIKARTALPQKAKSKINLAHFHYLVPSYEQITFNYETRQANNIYELTFKNTSGQKFSIRIEAIIPQEVIRKLPGFLWPAATGRKKASRPTDIVKEDTFNPRLLDSLCMVYCNDFRAENNLPPLLWQHNIYRASKHHATTMACLGAIFHGQENQDIYGPPDSVSMYKKYTSARTFSGTGENVLYNFTPGNGYSYARTAQYIIEQWIDSPGHRENMLRKDYIYGTTAVSIANYRGQLGAFAIPETACTYYPDLCKLFNIFSGMARSLNTKTPICFASQNFGGEIK